MTGGGDGDNLVGNIIECNGSIDGLIKEYSEVTHGKSPSKLEKLREDKGVIVFDPHQDDVGEDDEYIYVPKSMSSKALLELPQEPMSGGNFNNDPDLSVDTPHPEGELSGMNYPDDESEVKDEDDDIQGHMNA